MNVSEQSQLHADAQSQGKPLTVAIAFQRAPTEGHCLRFSSLIKITADDIL